MVVVGDRSLKMVNNHKLLGITVDNQLKWNGQMDILMRTFASFSYFGGRTTACELSTDIAKIVYHAIFELRLR